MPMLHNVNSRIKGPLFLFRESGKEVWDESNGVCKKYLLFAGLIGL